MATILIEDIIQQLNDLDNGDVWLDENFAKKLGQVGEADAFVRPMPDMHSVAELLAHLVVWRRINIRRMNGETVKVDIDDPVNWQTNNELRINGWDALKRDFARSRQEVIDLLAGKDDSYLATVSTHYGKDFKYLLYGLIHHDVYHLGQLGITVKYLQKAKAGSL